MFFTPDKKNIFCTVAAICNLVEEFNGLVSTGDWCLPIPFFIVENT
jgi:hypothetical protein